MTENVKLSPRRQKFLTALLTARNVREAAKAAGYSERQAYRVLRDPDFRAELDAARQEATVLVTTRLAESATEALDVLMSIAGNRIENAATRVAAAKAILTFALGDPTSRHGVTISADAPNPIKFIEVCLGADDIPVE